MARVLIKIEPNPKRVNSGAWIRYNGYYLGAAEADVLARGITSRDLAWDLSQGFVAFGEGDRVEPPALAPAPATPSETRTTTRTVPEALAATPVASDPLRVSSAERRVSAVAGSVEVSRPADKPASYWLTPIRIDFSAPVADHSLANDPRAWEVRVHLPDGRTLRRSVQSDRLAASIVQLAALHGIDLADWLPVES